MKVYCTAHHPLCHLADRCFKLSDHQYGFQSRHSTGDLLAFLTNLWSSYFVDFGETFTIALDISKAFDRVWHKAWISTLPFFCFYPLCSFISNFLSDHSIAAVVDGHFSSPKPINSGVPQGSVLSSTSFKSLLNLTQRPIHSYADDSTLHFTFLSRRPNQKQVNDSRGDATQRLSSISLISNWGGKHFVLFNASKTQFLHLSTQKKSVRQLFPLLRWHRPVPLFYTEHPWAILY